MTAFAKKIKELRLTEKLTQEKVASYLKISRATYGRYEEGEREPSYEILCKLADFYKVTTDYLLGRED